MNGGAEHVLVLNCGSSSLRADLVEARSGRRAFAARVERIGDAGATLRVGHAEEALAARDHGGALGAILERLLAETGGGGVAAVGHRVVHGGERFVAPVRIDDAVEAAIAELRELAPLHNPIQLAVIRTARRALSEAPHVAVFDTAFHATLSPAARTYALPRALLARHGLRRYGFHGTSHAWVARRAAEHLGADLASLRLVTCHLGNGCSVTAVEGGRSVETSMGMTPLEGLVMGTRSGDVDPGVLLELLRREGLDADALDALLNRESGLAGLSGVGSDLRDVLRHADAGDADARLAVDVFCHRLRKYLGAYAAVLGGVDAIVFTGGIGENSALVRERVTARLGFLGVHLDAARNRAARVDAARPVVEIAAAGSPTRILVAATDEAHAVAWEVFALLHDAA